MKADLYFLAAVFSLFVSFTANSAEVIIDGISIIRNGDYGQARDLAIKRAMSRAVESLGARVNSETIVRPGVVLESIQLRSSAYVNSSQVINEKIVNDELTVTMRVAVSEPGLESESCQSNYMSKILVLDFGFEFSDQLLPSEKSIFKFKTPIELARIIRNNQSLQVALDEKKFPYFSPSSAPEPFISKMSGGNPFVNISTIHRAQYVISGVYRDFGLSSTLGNKLSRRIEIEAFIHDGASGELVSKKIFLSTATGSVVLLESPILGTPSFYKTDFGKTWGFLLNNIAKWAEGKISCLPFISRIIKIDGNQIYINSGSKSGLVNGDVLNFQVHRKYEIFDEKNISSPDEKVLHTKASIAQVHPDYSIIHIAGDDEIISKVNISDTVSIR